MQTKSKRRLLRYIAVSALFLSEVTAALVAGGVVAALILPYAHRSRGYWGVGGEWGLILAAAFGGYIIYHNWLFREPERNHHGKHERNGRAL